MILLALALPLVVYPVHWYEDAMLVRAESQAAADLYAVPWVAPAWPPPVRDVRRQVGEAWTVETYPPFPAGYVAPSADWVASVWAAHPAPTQAPNLVAGRIDGAQPPTVGDGPRLWLVRIVRARIYSMPVVAPDLPTAKALAWARLKPAVYGLERAMTFDEYVGANPGQMPSDAQKAAFAAVVPKIGTFPWEALGAAGLVDREWTQDAPMSAQPPFDDRVPESRSGP